jgi:hypothetical protein
VGRPTTAPGWNELEIVLYVALALGLDFLLARTDGRRLTLLVSRRWIPETLFVTGLVVFTVLVGENHVLPFVYFQF